MSSEEQNRFAGKLRSFSQTSRSRKLSPQQVNLSSLSICLSSKTVVSCVCTCSPSPRLLSCSRLPLFPLQPVAVWSPRQRTPSPPSLSLSDCAEGVFASYQLMLAKESRKNYFRSADGDATTFKSRSERRTTTRLFNHSGRLW